MLAPALTLAQAHFPIFEAVARYSMPQSPLQHVCAGAKAAANPYYQCQALTGDARVVCDALFYGAQRSYSCNTFKPNTQKPQRDICDGIFYGALGGYNCDALNPTTPNPKPVDFYAKENCQGVYQARFNPNSCHQLSASPRAMAICNYIKNWKLESSPCK